MLIIYDDMIYCVKIVKNMVMLFSDVLNALLNFLFLVWRSICINLFCPC